MPQHISQFAITIRDYDEAIEFYVGKLGFTLLEDTDLGEGKRWVRVTPPVADAPSGDARARGSTAGLLLARAATPQQLATVGNQTGGRVFIFLETDDFWRDYNAMKSKGVVFLREPSEAPFGTVAVFQDLYGNKFDLIQRKG